MSELRQDPASGEWVLIASGRKQRPQDWGKPAAEPLPAHDTDCPFCPGNEARLPGILEEVPSALQPGWAVRVVPNKYPAVSETAQSSSDAQPYAEPALGKHRVIVETPRHDLDFDGLTPEAAAGVVEIYHQQFCTLADMPDAQAVILFRNYGPSAGASRQHSHTQIISLNSVPPKMAAAKAFASHAFERHGECPALRALGEDLKSGVRVIEQTAHYALLVPYAASMPFEMQILPLRHQASFAQTNEAERADLAALVQRALARLKAVIGQVDYNWVIESVLPEQAIEADHWGLRIVPKLSVGGGFEIGTHLPINPSLPEDDAKALRDAVLD